MKRACNAVTNSVTNSVRNAFVTLTPARPGPARPVHERDRLRAEVGA